MALRECNLIELGPLAFGFDPIAHRELVRTTAYFLHLKRLQSPDNYNRELLKNVSPSELAVRDWILAESIVGTGAHVVFTAPTYDNF